MKSRIFAISAAIAVLPALAGAQRWCRDYGYRTTRVGGVTIYTPGYYRPRVLQFGYANDPLYWPSYTYPYDSRWTSRRVGSVWVIRPTRHHRHHWR
jgi:hypothetical protein